MKRELFTGLVLALSIAACSDDMQDHSSNTMLPISGTGGLTTAGGVAGTAPSTTAGRPSSVLPTGPSSSGTSGLPNPGGGAAGAAPTLPPTSGGVAGGPGSVPPPPVTGGTGGPVTPPPPAGGTGAVPPPPVGSVKDPVVPMLTAECPMFRGGTINFMGLGGITVAAGTKPSSPTAPMLFYWHGTGSFSGEYATMAAAVAQGIQSEGGVLISFQGTTGGDLLSGTAIFGKGDLNLTDQLFACAVKNQNVDPKRVFATGCSAGGLMSASMATLRSSYMAAAATNSGGWTAPLQFDSKHIPALMTIHGAPGVDVVIIDFSNSSATADKAFAAAGGFVINCNHGGGHCGGGGLAGDIWKFFKAHPFGVDPYPWKGGLPSGFSSQCKIYDPATAPPPMGGTGKMK
ncbi:MAG TPA: hypothetical protein VJR89_17545 [Polyangiales bacterium]|nr:hypothetical protein [Polyangiales bacterium]